MSLNDVLAAIMIFMRPIYRILLEYLIVYNCEEAETEEQENMLNY
jgi:hypothetical protein